jgi:hypothetical protein
MERKNEICSVKIIHFININMTLVVIFMILKKSLFVSYVLNVQVIVTSTIDTEL